MTMSFVAGCVRETILTHDDVVAGYVREVTQIRDDGVGCVKETTLIYDDVVAGCVREVNVICEDDAGA